MTRPMSVFETYGFGVDYRKEASNATTYSLVLKGYVNEPRAGTALDDIVLEDLGKWGNICDRSKPRLVVVGFQPVELSHESLESPLRIRVQQPGRASHNKRYHGSPSIGLDGCLGSIGRVAAVQYRENLVPADRTVHNPLPSSTSFAPSLYHERYYQPFRKHPRYHLATQCRDIFYTRQRRNSQLFLAGPVVHHHACLHLRCSIRGIP